MFHCEDKQASSLRIFCPSLYHKSLENTFLDNQIFDSLDMSPTALVNQMVASLERSYGKKYLWTLGTGRQLSSGDSVCGQEEETVYCWMSIISFVDSPFRPMLNILARVIFQLIPVGCCSWRCLRAAPNARRSTGK